MKRLIGWLTQRWVLSIAALIVLSLLIWLFGRDLAFAGHTPLASTAAQLIAILVLVLSSASYHIVRLLRERTANAAMVNGLAAEAATPAAEDPTAVASRAERDALALRFREALATLKEARLGGSRRRTLYQLPWYVIIGPSGAGKTTALINSGLRFPLKDRFGEEALQGTGGTRNCRWFFSDEAVLIDTAGRYSTQDSDAAVDRSAWAGFLELLRRNRPRRPIDGILVAFSITEIANDPQAKRLAHARAVKSRVLELYAALKLTAPIYVIFTQCDRVAGFREFFADLSQEERAQVWGVTVSLRESQDPNSVVDGFNEDYAQLLDRLTTRTVPRLAEERDIDRRSLLLSFPQQMKLMAPALQEFLGELFGQSRFETPLLVRGIYLTSATQAGSPIDRVIGAVAASFQLPREALPAFSGRGVSYFLTRLLREVIFREAGLVSRTGLFSRYRSQLEWAAYGGIAAVTLLLLTLWTVSWFGNRALIADVDTRIDALKQTHATALNGRGSAGETLAALEAIANLPYGYIERDESPPISLTFGLFQGDKLGAAEQAAYRRGLDRLFIPMVAYRLEEQIAGNLGNADFSYQALKAYLMLSTPERLDPAFLTLWVATDWNSRFPGAANAQLRDEFARCLQAAFAEPIETLPPVNEALVARARAELLQQPPGARIYAQLKSQQLATKSRDWTLAGQVAPEHLRYFQRKSGEPMTAGIPFLYTVEGYRGLFVENRRKLIDDALQETWVLGPEYTRLQSESERADLARKVEELYLTDYIAAWDALVRDLEFVPAPNVEAQADLVRAIAQPNSPLKAVIDKIVAQTQLSKALIAAQSDKGPAEVGQVGRLRDRIEGWLGGSAAAADSYDPGARVDRHFEPLAALVRQEGGAPSRIEAVLQPFGKLYDFLLQTKQTPGGTAPGAFAGDFARGRELVAQLQGTTKTLPEPVGRMLTGLATTTQRSTLDPKRIDALQRINQIWRSSVAPACREALAGRYPMVRSSSEDVNVADFARVFAAGGLIDGFFKQYLQPYADSAVHPWRWIDASAGGLGFTLGSLRMFEDAARIRQAFFAGGAQPQVGFELEPLSLDPRAREVELDLGGQKLTYGHGPRTATPMHWPANTPGARLTLTPVDTPGQSIVNSPTGAWALFRLLDSARIDASAGPDRLKVGFDLQGYQATFQLRAASIVNPFVLPELQKFQCRDQL
jgi:type VI secretion system protein ImpL